MVRPDAVFCVHGAGTASHAHISFAEDAEVRRTQRCYVTRIVPDRGMAASSGQGQVGLCIVCGSKMPDARPVRAAAEYIASREGESNCSRNVWQAISTAVCVAAAGEGSRQYALSLHVRKRQKPHGVGLISRWRKRIGVEPTGDISATPPVLKTGRNTGYETLPSGVLRKTSKVGNV